MKVVNKEVLKEAAEKLMFTMSEKEFDTLLEEFDIIIKQMKLIAEIPGVDNAMPMTFPFDVRTSYLREDEITTPLSREDVLKNSGDVVDGEIRLPKVVG